MKHTIRKITGFLAVAVTVFMLLPLSAWAGNTVLSVSKSDIKAGDEFTVTVSGASASNLSLHYDGTMVTLKSQGQASLDGNTLSINAKSATFTFTAKKAGSAGFVGSSDQYARSSAMISIGEAAAAKPQTAETKTEDSNEKKSSKTTDADKSTDKKSKDTEDTDQVVSVSTNDPDDDTDVSDAKTDVSENTAQEDSAAQQEYPFFSSADLSLKELVTDRRIIAIIGVLVAIIIILVIRLLWIHFSEYEYYDDEESEDDEEATEERVSETQKTPETKKSKNTEPDDTDALYEKLKEEEKLTMPKTPVVPEKKLHLEDLNNL